MNLIAFADLAHTGTVVGANNSPLAVGYIAAYAKKQLGDELQVRLFKYPEALAKFLENESPRIVAFSNYMWNERLSLTFARAIKKHDPSVVTVFGGPNYPIDATEQRKFLLRNPEVDFYIDGEGEVAFFELFKVLKLHDFSVESVKAAQQPLPSLHYIHNDAFVRNPLLPRALELDETLPSPYLMGLMDEFFDTTLTPLLQTSRGCPYSCTFCHDGIAYMSKTRRFSQGRVRSELEYAAKRAKVPALTLADLNWGMFPDDVETANDCARLRKRDGWPQFVGSATAKNQKVRVVEMAKILGNAMHLGASVQSTDAQVLHNIKRSNIGIDAIVTMAKASAQNQTPTFTEIILCLPGDTREKHFKSVFDMLDAGIQEARTYQLILLPGTETNTVAARKQYAYDTRFRVLPRSFGKYRIYGEEYSVAETHEVCVGNSTMPHEDYLECRRFNLTLGIFNNGNMFDEIFNLGDVLGIKRSQLVDRIHSIVVSRDGPLRGIYTEYLEDEGRNFWRSAEELEAFVHDQGGIDEYLAGRYGSNQIFKFRTKAILEHIDEVIEIAMMALREELASCSIMDAVLTRYLDELLVVVRSRKARLGDLDYAQKLNVHFDFVALQAAGFRVDPRELEFPDGLDLIVDHDPQRKKTLRSYFVQYGTDLEGLAHFIHRNPASELYRGIAYADKVEGTTDRVQPILRDDPSISA